VPWVAFESVAGCPDIVLLAGFFAFLDFDMVLFELMLLLELIVFEELVVLGELIVLPELAAAGCVAVVDAPVLSAAMATSPSTVARTMAGTMTFKDGMLVLPPNAG